MSERSGRGEEATEDRVAEGEGERRSARKRKPVDSLPPNPPPAESRPGDGVDEIGDQDARSEQPSEAEAAPSHAEESKSNEVIVLSSDDSDEDEAKVEAICLSSGESSDDGGENNNRFAWADDARPGQLPIPICWRDEMPKTGKNTNGHFDEFGKKVDLRRFIEKHDQYATMLNLSDRLGKGEGIVGIIISKSLALNFPEIDDGGQYVIGYLDDNNDRKIIAMKIGRAKKYFCEE